MRTLRATMSRRGGPSSTAWTGTGESAFTLAMMALICPSGPTSVL